MILHFKKYNYGTVIINLEAKKIIEILNTRDPNEVEKALKQYPNLHTISRYRGYSYSPIS